MSTCDSQGEFVMCLNGYMILFVDMCIAILIFCAFMFLCEQALYSSDGQCVHRRKPSRMVSVELGAGMDGVVMSVLPHCAWKQNEPGSSSRQVCNSSSWFDICQYYSNGRYGYFQVSGSFFSFFFFSFF